MIRRIQYIYDEIFRLKLPNLGIIIRNGYITVACNRYSRSLWYFLMKRWCVTPIFICVINNNPVHSEALFHVRGKLKVMSYQEHCKDKQFIIQQQIENASKRKAEWNTK